MRYRIFLKDRDTAVQVDGDKITKMAGSGELVVEKESKPVAEFKSDAWTGWVEEPDPGPNRASPYKSEKASE